MRYNTESKVEKYFQQFDSSFSENYNRCNPQTLVTDNYVVLGQLTALRFIEWVSLNPGGVVALPTGKTPEFFIKWLEYYLSNWDKETSNGIIGKLGIEKPDFKSLSFFQLDEFFPINPEHERSFRYFVKKYYIDLLGFDPEKTHLINTYFLNPEEQRQLGGAKNLGEVFTDGTVDLSLRIRSATTKEEAIRQQAIRMFDRFCTGYEQKIRSLGGLGFFLGGIGPDGHIAFNVRGSSPFSHTRLTNLNYESQAAAAGDMGGINTVRRKAVVTMGLETITYNPDCVAIIIAAGQSKAKVVCGSVLGDVSMDFPASSLKVLPHARFFITKAASVELPPSTSEDEDEATKVMSSVKHKIENGLQIPENQVILHTGPHHDDIELAYFPYLHHLVRSKNIENHFAYCTSGYTSVTSSYLREVYDNMRRRIHPQEAALMSEDIESVYTTGYDDDLTMYLRGIARMDVSTQHFAVARRLARKWIGENGNMSVDQLRAFVEQEIMHIDQQEPGRREPATFHTAKGWLREFEAELVWAHFGLGSDRVTHLQLPFYSDDIFPHYPDMEHDVKPILDLLMRVKPTIVSLALDPEGSGPDTHFKSLIALNAALELYHKEFPSVDLHIWGYRNVWSRFKMNEVNKLIPVSLNSFAVIKNMFDTCYLSQRSADFPSYEHDGPFSELAQKTWVEQHNDVCRLIGEEFFYRANNPMLQRAYGMIYLKDMTWDEFVDYMKPVKRLLEVKDGLKV